MERIVMVMTICFAKLYGIAATAEDLKIMQLPITPKCFNNGTPYYDDHFRDKCKCQKNFTEPRCYFNTTDKPCNQSKCQNGATCIDGDWNYKYRCHCPPSFVGPLCEVDNAQQLCGEQYCNRRGTIVFSDKGCSCKCMNHTSGDNCEKKDPCFGKICGSGYCQLKNGKASCKCLKYYKGKNCSELDTANLTGGNPCHDDACHGEKCEPIVYENGSAVAMCLCNRTIRRGRSCEKKRYEYNPCTTDSHGLGACGKNGDCMVDDEEWDVVKCKCYPKWMGPLCEDHDPCYYRETVPELRCKHGTPCEWVREFYEDEGIVTKYKCHCGYAYEGEYCQNVRYKHCINVTCSGNGVCKPCKAKNEEDEELVNDKACKPPRSNIIHGGTVFRYKYWCDCELGYGGRDCENNVSICEQIGDLCLNGGTCHDDENGTYWCTCRKGYKGDRCHIVPDMCVALSPCLNDGACVPLKKSPGYRCNCVEGFKGVDCAIPTDTAAKFRRNVIIGSLFACAGYVTVVIILTVVTWPSEKKERKKQEKIKQLYGTRAVPKKKS